MGKFQKGNSGRPKGTPNKVTAETKERIQRVINALDETLLGDLASMKPQNKEPITDVAQPIYMERGVKMASCDIRTDRWEVAREAKDKVTAAVSAKYQKRAEAKAEPKAEPKADPKTE